MGRGDRRKCKCCRKLFRPDPRNRRHSVTARPRSAERPAKPPASVPGLPSLRTKTTSAARRTSLGSSSGDRAIQAIGAEGIPAALRYKRSQ